jgi:hypothetical protein
MNPKEQGVRHTEIEDERADKNRLSPNAIQQRPEQRNQQGETDETDRLGSEGFAERQAQLRGRAHGIT